MQALPESERLPEFQFDPAARTDACDRCSRTASGGADLRFVILRGRERYVGRTLCDLCAEEALEAFIAE